MCQHTDEIYAKVGEAVMRFSRLFNLLFHRFTGSSIRYGAKWVFNVFLPAYESNLQMYDFFGGFYFKKSCIFYLSIMVKKICMTLSEIYVRKSHVFLPFLNFTNAEYMTF